MVGAPKFPVKLTSTYAHDVRAIVAATPKAGAYYIVNPNPDRNDHSEGGHRLAVEE